MRNTIIVKLDEQINSLHKEYEFYVDNVYGYDDEPYISVADENGRYFMNEDTVRITEDELKDLYSSLESYHDELNDIVENFDDDQCIEFENFIDFVNDLKEVVDEVEEIVYDSDLSDYLNFDFNSRTMESLNDEYGLEATEDRVDEFMEICQQDSFDAQKELFEANKAQLSYLNKVLQKLLKDYKHIKSAI